MTFLRTLAAGATAAALSFAAATAADATVTRYDITGVGSGVLDGVGFSGQSFDITMLADPDLLAVVSPFPGFTFDEINPVQSIAVTIGGGPALTVTTPARIGMANIGPSLGDLFVGNADEVSFDLFDVFLPLDFATFDFRGPLTVSEALPGLNGGGGGVFATSGGPLSFGPARDVVFSISGVPEPTTWALMLTGFLALGAALRRRHAPI